MKYLVFPMVFILNVISAFPQSDNTDNLHEEWQRMNASKSEAFESFNEAKFGLFITWGVYSVPAGIWEGEKIPGLGEWIMHRAKIPRDDYRNICNGFNPIKFDAEAWVRIAKQAGMKYIVAMPKHHDGFAMYDSEVTDYDIVDATPFKRDPMEELYWACQKYGLNFSIYYSHATDWMDGGDAGVDDYIKANPNARDEVVSDFWLRWPANTWDPSPLSFTEYLEQKAKPQMKELLKKFPGMQEIWYDVPRRMTREQSFEFYKLAYELQPECLINSRVGNDFGDYWIPGDNKIPEGDEAEGYIWETPGTLNNTWGYKSYDNDWKSDRELLFWITEITSKGGNYLLNVGPTSEGLFPQQSIDQLEAIGEWMKINGESVYGTSKWIVNHEGPVDISMEGSGERERKGFNANFTSEDFWFSKKDNCIYVTSLKWPDNDDINIKSLARINEDHNKSIESVHLLGYDKDISWSLTKEGLHATLPKYMPNIHGYVLKINMKN